MSPESKRTGYRLRTAPDPLLLMILSALGSEGIACTETASSDPVGASSNDDADREPTTPQPPAARMTPVAVDAAAPIAAGPTPVPTPNPGDAPGASAVGPPANPPLGASGASVGGGGTSGSGTSGSGTSGSGTSGAGPALMGPPGGTSGAAGAESEVREGVVGCEDPRPHIDESTGWIACARDPEIHHRATVGACAGHEATDAGVGLPGEACIRDSDCSSIDRGRCFHEPSGGGRGPTGCVTDCLSDDDCLAGEVCFCGEDVNLCIPSDCNTDVDCGAGFLCATYRSDSCSNAPDGVACQTPDDECTVRDCYFEDGKRVVREESCGRPFLVAGAARTADPVADAGWVDASLQLTLQLETLSPEVRRELAARFTRLGLMEHASIAAFTRFSLELLAMAAPPELIAAALQAAQDEQRHASLCFSVASAYAARPIGPGPLSIEGAAPCRDLAGIVETTFLEGCVGETVAAIEARELARQVDDPVLMGVFASIAEDEAKHAALAWRFVQWALKRAPAAVRPVVERLAFQVANEHDEASHGSDVAGLARYGLVSVEQSREIRARGLRDVVQPCASSLLSQLDASSPLTPASTSSPGLSNWSRA